MKNKKIINIATLVMIMGLCSFAYAEDTNDLTTGPGVGLSESSWDGNGKIYNPNSNGIVAQGVVEANALELAPKTVESTIINPIDNSQIDMGPTSAANWQLSLHNLNDNGPGQALGANVTNPGTIYNVGPGANIIIQPKQDKGPIYADNTTTNVDPSNALLDMGPASSTEIYQHKKKA